MSESLVRIRPYAPGDEDTLVRIWNDTLRRDPITPAVFREKILLDPNFDRAGALVAEAGGRPAGFCLAIARKVPLDGAGLQPERGWITVFFVRPDLQRRGIGRRLIDAALEYLARRGRREVWVATYVPNCFQPGVDVDAYHAGIRLLERAGFVPDHYPVGMGRSLLDYEFPAGVAAREAALAAQGTVVRDFEPRDIVPLLEFLDAHFPGDCPRLVRERLLRGTDLDEILVAEHAGNIIGYAHVRGERFGPFAVHPAEAGRGVGTVLFHRAVERMRQKGRQNLWLAWTHGEAQRFYERNGLVVRRRHAVLRRDLG